MSIGNGTIKGRRLYVTATFGFLSLICLVPLLGCAQQGSSGTQSEKPSGPELGIALREANGTVTIAEVEDHSPAAEAGLQEGDELVSANSKKIESASGLKEEIRSASKSEPLALEIRRDRELKTVHAYLGDSTNPAAVSGTMGISHNESPRDKQKGNESSQTSVAAGSAESPEPDTTNESPQSERHVVGYRGTAGASSESESISDQDVGAVDAKNSTVDELPAAEQADSTSATSNEEAASNSPSDSPDLDTDAANEKPEITADEVEEKLEEAKTALEGFMRQKEKLDYRKRMETQLHDFDKNLTSREQELTELEERLAQKKQRLKDIRAKRDALVQELNSLDPATTAPWESKRERIENAWKELSNAPQSSSSSGASAEE